MREARSPRPAAVARHDTPANIHDTDDGQSLLWERYRVAALIHDAEHTDQTWFNRQNALHAWSAVFLGAEP